MKLFATCEREKILTQSNRVSFSKKKKFFKNNFIYTHFKAPSQNEKVFFCKETCGRNFRK